MSGVMIRRGPRYKWKRDLQLHGSGCSMYTPDPLNWLIVQWEVQLA